MKVLEINKISADDNFIYYRRNYKAAARLQMLSKVLDVNIAFTIEMDPFGGKAVYVDLDPATDIDYPLIPVKTALKTFITTMDNEGKLPCA